ncbi:hypothetical protein CR513_25496, partial [Mucuna pruriens]
AEERHKLVEERYKETLKIVEEREEELRRQLVAAKTRLPSPKLQRSDHRTIRWKPRPPHSSLGFPNSDLQTFPKNPAGSGHALVDHPTTMIHPNFQRFSKRLRLSIRCQQDKKIRGLRAGQFSDSLTLRKP